MSFRRSFRIVVPALGVALVIATVCTAVPLLFVALVVTGALQGVLAITGNVEADRMETTLGRQVLVRAHGFYSLATVLAGALGTGFRAVGMAPWLHLLIVLPFATTLAVLATRGMAAQPGRGDEAASEPTRIVRPTVAVFLFFLAGGSALYLDNAASDWSVILLRDGYGADLVVATMAVAIWALGQTCGRLAYPYAVQRIGGSRLAIAMVGIAAVGVGLVALSSEPVLAIGGLLLMGLGTSALFPMAISAAARLSDRSSAANVASLSQLAFLMGIATPVVLGGLVQVAGIRLAFSSGALVLAISLVVLLLRHPFQRGRLAAPVG